MILYILQLVMMAFIGWKMIKSNIKVNLILIFR